MGKEIRALSLGAGVQSSALYLMACDGDIDIDVAIFADTGAEPAWVYEHLAFLETLGGPEIVRVQGGLGLTHAILEKGRIPSRPDWYDIPAFHYGGISRRQCTKNFKIIPIHRELRRWVGAKGSAAILMGISLDEVHRMKEPRAKWLKHEYPLIDRRLRRGDCLRLWQERYPDRALRKSSCTFCPYHSAATWLELADGLSLAEWEVVRSVDAKVAAVDGSRLHNSMLPIDDAIASLRQARLLNPRMPGFEQDGFGNECEGHCGV